ncbi:MAG: hypothetical protein Q8P28_09920 [Deltaproteobacteria bacterium]|nr:hypothetical protein [Deltaproteobacteria bacterium]
MKILELAIHDINRMKEALIVSSAVKSAIEMQQRLHETVSQSVAIKSAIEFARMQQAYREAVPPTIFKTYEYYNAFEMINRDMAILSSAAQSVKLASQQIKTFESFKPAFLREYESFIEKAKEVESIRNRYPTMLFQPFDTLPVVQRRSVLIALPYKSKREETVFPSKKSAYSVCNLIIKCNEKACVLGSNDIFKPTNKMMESIKNIQHLSCNDKKTFSDFIDCLYFMLYEGAGEGSRVKIYLSDEEYQPLHDIRDIRNFYCRHDIEHGDSGEIKKKYRKLGEIFLRLIEKPLPENEIDFKKAQYVILDNLHNVLGILYKKIS